MKLNAGKAIQGKGAKPEAFKACCASWRKTSYLDQVASVMTERGSSELRVIWSHEMGDNLKVTNHVWVSNKHSNLGKVNEMHKLT